MMKEKRKARYHIVGKTIAFILLLFSIISVPVGIYGTYTMVQKGFYLTDGEELKDAIVSETAGEVALELLYGYHNGGVYFTNKRAEEYQCHYMIHKNGAIMASNFDDDLPLLWTGSFSFGRYEAGRYVFEGVEEYEISVCFPERAVPDEISFICFIAEHSSVLKVAFPVAAVLGVIIFIGSFVTLLCLAGGRNEENQPVPGLFGKIPADVFTVCILLLGYGWYHLLCRLVKIGSIEMTVACVVGYFLLFLIWSMSVSARRKAGGLWSNMIVPKLWEALKKLGGYLLCSVPRLPLIWKTILIFLILSLVEFLGLLWVKHTFTMLRKSYVVICELWVAEKILLLPVICYLALQLKMLKKAGRELAEGNLEYQVDTGKLFWELKEHGEDLNRISEGVNKAVSERMKSEHFKTELITNVSHDIKTPLTSIINYSDLLKKEECDNEKIKEYADVLHRQSTRLKKLIEDLMEASKASTGSLEVNPEVCEVGVLLEQALGEFEQPLYEKNMDVITKLPQEPLKIMADGKHLWRVFDNLLNNICKYGQSGTRVYLTVEKVKDKVVITFKNISQYPLDISEEELMERFVRGDKSRHTEGNGLGLNIAKSLTQLQKGSLELVIDGDLFKVILTFPILE